MVIGRNEGEGLLRCLESVLRLGCPVVYADSDSSDGSAALARSLGLAVVQLDTSRAMNAARGRKAGCERLLAEHQSLEHVLFIDGDCELDPAFVPAALAVMVEAPDVGVVCGHLTERYPHASIYNRIADLEWNAPPGLCNSCGGNALMRTSAYMMAGGFDETVQAGEEPELCARIRQCGFTVMRIDAPMGSHDLDMHRLSQWWRRGVRSGLGALDVRRRFGLRDFDRIMLGAWLWVFGWPIFSLALVWGVGAWLGAAVAAVAALLALAVLPLQVLRIARSARLRGLAYTDALAYGTLMMVDKWACAWGQVKGWLQPSSRSGRLPLSPWQQDLRRYPPRPFLKEQSIWAIAVYRWGHGLFQRPPSLKKRMLVQLYWLCFRCIETLTGISLPYDAKIGGGLRIHHFGNIFINPCVVIGSNCTLRQGVTLGNRVADGSVPVIGDDVEFGAYAQVLGGVKIGAGARVGAMSVVLFDVPAGCTAVGNPARIVGNP